MDLDEDEDDDEVKMVKMIAGRVKTRLASR
jgi:hypothetical protein